MRARLTIVLCLALTGCGIRTINPFDSIQNGPNERPAAYVVFFQGHETSLSPDAKRIIAAVADEAKNRSGLQVEVSGPSTRIVPGYDPRYAQPRIDAVMAELMADGVSRDRIAEGSSLTDTLKADINDDQRVEMRVIKR